MRKIVAVLSFMIAFQVQAQDHNPGSNHGNRFEQLDYLLQTPNEYRTASGAPGPKYWQQRADYDIAVDIDEANNVLTGAETITYFNNSPNTLTYIWLQLDENFHRATSNNNLVSKGKVPERVYEGYLNGLDNAGLKGLGLNLTEVTDATKKDLVYTVNQTMMRIELPTALKPGQKFVFNIKWNYKINDKAIAGGRAGFEHFADDDNNLYSIAQFYPRMAVYSDFQGWQHLQFTGGAEFALTFGNYNLKITVPEDHVVASTGELKNMSSVLTAAQQKRYAEAQNATEPTEVVTLADALEASKTKKTGKKTWVFYAENVRDVAFNTSRRLVWDAMPVFIEGKKIMCMSFYGKEAYPLYKKYSTKVIAHTLKVYSRISIPYPYPVAQSVEANNGMEYPMLAMNHGRADKDGNYSTAIRNSAIGVIIHEVGHNFFPMIVNSDERQWWWMDEGLNTFCEYIAEKEFESDFPTRRGPAQFITGYMSLPKDQLEPIMTKGDAVANVGSNAYAKAATGLNILRETVMGKDLFDYSFKEYAKRWAFKHPTPADLFRTMEDASAIDLDWFWRGWYFGTDPCDISLDSVKLFKSDATATTAANLYELSFTNKGGLVMPVIVEWTFADGTKETDRIPVNVWALNEKQFTKVFKKSKEVKSIQLDPLKETADINVDNGVWPAKVQPSTFQIFKGSAPGRMR
jgi:hypothetical protein